MNESRQTLPPAPYAGETPLRELIGVLWAGKWLICGLTAFAIVASLITALSLPNMYRAQALLAPNQDGGAGGLAALAAQYGGIASLAGINLGGDSSDKTAEGLEILKSRKFISDFIQRHDILVPLIAAEGWDVESGELIIDPNIYDTTAHKWVRNVRRPKKTIPSLQEAFEKFSEDVLSVSQDKRTSFVRVSVEHYSPIVAKRWVDWLIEDINATVMRKDVSEAEQAIEYLNEQINATSLADLQSVFFRLIEEQTKTVMLAKITDEYLLKTLDPAVAPEKKAWPSRALILILGCLVGALAGVSLALFRANSSPVR